MLYTGCHFSCSNGQLLISTFLDHLMLASWTHLWFCDSQSSMLHSMISLALSKPYHCHETPPTLLSFHFRCDQSLSARSMLSQSNPFVVQSADAGYLVNSMSAMTYAHSWTRESTMMYAVWTLVLATYGSRLLSKTCVRYSIVVTLIWMFAHSYKVPL